MALNSSDALPPSYSPNEEGTAIGLLHCTVTSDDPMPVDTTVFLTPTTPSRNPRYNERNMVALSPSLMVIPAKTRLRSLSQHKPALPDGWKEWQHPEGDAYHFHADKRIVTPSDVRSEVILGPLETALQDVMTKLGLGDLNYVEIYLNVLLDHGGTPWAVEYYLVDHQARQIFWVDNVPATTIGIAGFPSFGFLKSILTPEYWTHMDYYPMHTRQEYLRAPEEELISMLSHGRVDTMTAPGSTCPYSSEECTQYIEVVERNTRFQSPEVIGYRAACVARLWSAMARARHINNYGLEGPRLDRLHGLCEFRESFKIPSRKLRMAESLTFHASAPIWDRLTNLYNGRVVYQRHWSVLFDDLRRNWFMMGTLAAAILMADMVLLCNNIAIASTVASTSLASGSLFTAIYLQLLHPEYLLGTAPEISQYVAKYEYYPHGLRPMSIILALPQALATWAAVALLCSIVISTVERTETLQEAVTVVIAFALGAIPVFIAALFLAPSVTHGPPAAVDSDNTTSASAPTKH